MEGLTKIAFSMLLRFSLRLYNGGEACVINTVKDDWSTLFLLGIIGISKHNVESKQKLTLKPKRAGSWGLVCIKYCMQCYRFMTLYSIIVGIPVEHSSRTAILKAKCSVGKCTLANCWEKQEPMQFPTKF